MQTTTMQASMHILIKEYREVNAAMIYVLRNMNGLTKSVVLNTLQARFDELCEAIRVGVPHLITRDQMIDWIADFEKANFEK